MNFVIAYGYDPITGEYTGEVNAWESPLEPGVFMLPADATFEAPPEAEDGKYRAWNGSSWELITIPVPETPPPPTVEELAASARMERDGKLASCDWTQLSDVPLAPEAKTAWAVYRQALRDVPQQVGFPTEITWPTPPGV